MSALPPEADMLIVGINVCYVPGVRGIAWGTASVPHAATARGPLSSLRAGGRAGGGNP